MRPNLGTLSCQGRIVEVNFSRGESLGEDTPQRWSCVSGSAFLGACAWVLPEVQLHRVVIPECKGLL